MITNYKQNSVGLIHLFAYFGLSLGLIDNGSGAIIFDDHNFYSANVKDR